MKKIYKIIVGLASITAVFFFAVVVKAADSTVVVTANTSAGENLPGWMFNRDLSTSTPYAFTNAQSSIGAGSLYVSPIGANASDKFIGENFVNAPITDVNSISYDFKIGSGGVDTDEEQFYMNVYANFGVSDDLKFYDCRYSVVPVVGSTAGFTTVTFDPTQAYPVATRAGGDPSPFICPSVPADMNLSSAGSNIRMFALNVGDTLASDLGLDGYLDKVVVNRDSGVTTYDFEAVSSPMILTPANNAVVATSAMTAVDWTDSTGFAPIQYQYEAYADAAYTSLIYSSGWLASSQIATLGTPPGEYFLRVHARDGNLAESVWSNGSTNPHHITVTADPTPTPDPYALPVACAETGYTYGSPILGTNGSNSINGTSGNDLIFALGGSDIVNGGGGNDCIVGGAGSDSLRGGNGNDVILGGDGSDSLDGGNNEDKLYGEDGTDSLIGGNQNDELHGGNNEDSLRGGNGNDTLFGDNDNDSLRGDNGIDSLSGGDGTDSANGGSGNQDSCTAESESACEL